MKRHIYVFIILLTLFLHGCGGGGGVSHSRSDRLGNPQTNTQLPSESPPPQRNRLVTSTPILNKLSPGQEFDFVLRAELKDELFQTSARILYDPSVFSPIRTSKGNLIPEDAVFFAKLDKEGLLPFAITRLPGSEGIRAGTGEILRVRFRLLSTPQANSRIRLQNEPAFLQLRDKSGGRLSFDLATEVVAQ